MNVFLHHVAGVFFDSAPYLLIGFALAGLTQIVLGRTPRLLRGLSLRGPRAVALAALVGAPLPLCSCSVLPTAVALRRQGASRGATSSFLVSVPETDAVSVALTWGLLGPVMAIVRPLAAVCSALTAGLVVDALDDDPEARRVRGSSEQCTPDSTCCGADGAAPEETLDPRSWWRRALHFGFVEFFDDISAPLLFGLVVAGLVAAAAPMAQGWSAVQEPWIWYLFALVIGIPTYVCATASTPVAVGMVMAGMSPGAALVFLLVGPAISAASIAVLVREFGRRALGAHLAALATVALSFGVGMDLVLGEAAVRLGGTGDAHREPGLLGTISAVALVVLMVSSARRRRWIPRALRSALRASARFFD